MPYVLLDDSSLSDIANAIRNRNKLVRTYKPREMAPAIRALHDLIPQSDGYEVRIAQYEHQTIKVRRYLNEERTYTESFSTTKPFWKIQAEIEADPGYTPGVLNYPDEMSVDRDIFIQATPAEEVVSPPDTIYTVYIGGNGTWDNTRHYRDEAMTQQYGDGQNIDIKPQGRVIYHFIDAYGKKYGSSTYYRTALFGGPGGNGQTVHTNATDIIFSDLHLNGCANLSNILGGSFVGRWLENIDISSFDMSDVEIIGNLFQNNQNWLRSLGDISHWDTRNLRELGVIRYASYYVDSLDLSGWETPQLRRVGQVFPNGRIIDISNWNTSLIRSCSFPDSIKYIIMDKEEIKFDGTKYNYDADGGYKFGRVSGRKYLVPPTMVEQYKSHPNWSHIADQIDDVTKYTINRGNGEISITPNI